MHLIRFAMKGARLPASLPAALASEMGSEIGTLSPERKWVRKHKQEHRLNNSLDGEGAAAPASLGEGTSEHKPHHSKKKKKRKKKKARVPKGFSIVHEGGHVYFNSANGWFYDAGSLRYYKNESGPFFLYDAAQKKLVPLQKS